jgi:hypothetical protein
MQSGTYNSSRHSSTSHLPVKSPSPAPQLQETTDPPFKIPFSALTVHEKTDFPPKSAAPAPQAGQAAETQLKLPSQTATPAQKTDVPLKTASSDRPPEKSQGSIRSLTDATSRPTVSSSTSQSPQQTHNGRPRRVPAMMFERRN